MRNRIALVIFVFAFTMNGRAQQEPKSVSIKAIKTIQRTIVPIVCTRDNHGVWEPRRIIGSGFFINRGGYFLTAGHVVSEWERATADVGPCFPSIIIPIVSWSERDQATAEIGIRWFKFTECIYSSDADTAACKPIDNPFTNVDVGKQISPSVLGSIAKHPDGSPVAFTGFPLDFHVPVTSKGYVAAYAVADKRLVIDKSAWPGASGSPVYDAEGKVIGIIIQTGRAEGAGLTYARPIDLIIQFLRENKIPTEK